MVKNTQKKSCNNKKNIVITMGDPGGIGPELTLSLFSTSVSSENRLILIGDKKVFYKAKKLFNIDKEINIINDVKDFKENKINIIDIDFSEEFSCCKIDCNNGLSAFKSIKKAINLCLTGFADAMVTAPINKKSLEEAGIDFPGHTEILAEFTKTKKVRMLFLSEKFNVLLHTIHVPIKHLLEEFKKNNLYDTIALGVEFAKKNMKKDEPLIYVAGLNPHAGEHGKIGIEEDKYIVPVIKKFQSKNINILGPFPPDTVFFRALTDKPDIIIAMYHDQGLIPLKLTDFYGAVNVTIGLPFIRTSPDHGTAFDIAWQGKANNLSMLNAVKFASQLVS